MTANERATDQFVRDELRELGFTRPWEQGGGKNFPTYLYDALATASKGIGGGRGKPEFIIESGNFLVVIEDKANIAHSKLIDAGKILTEYPARNDYALNGAVHYAEIIAEKTNKKVFAVGVAGPESHNEITIAYVEQGMLTKRLSNVDALTDLAPENIEEYYRVAVKGWLPREEREVKEIRSVAAQLHEDMRNYASLEGERKATLVSAILLALRGDPDLLKSLTGRDPDQYPDLTDGVQVYNAAKSYLQSPQTNLVPQQKIGAMLDQFSFIRSHVLLNRANSNLGKTPMKRFVEVLDREVIHAVSDPSRSAFDILGSFYGEFVKYGGSDGNALGIVLTPHHITELMAELIDIDSDDIVIDPCAGTAGFLIAAMKRQFSDADLRYKNDSTKITQVRENIKKNQLHGVELQDKLFAIGTTNMILRGDGKANFQRHNFFDLDLHELRGDTVDADGNVIKRGHGFTKVLLNPPYSQSKSKETRHLSELSFVSRALDLLDHKGRLAAIVPQSAMVGKTKEDRALKAKIMHDHTLDAVITMNPDTFHGVGTHVVIAIFTAGVAHPETKKSTFINFKNDGYYVRQHVGLVGNGNEKSRKSHLLSVLNDGVPDETNFVVRTEVRHTDEWQHSFFYFNDQPPTYEVFLQTVADYVTWQVDMHTQGKGKLITPQDHFNSEEEEENQ